MISGKTQNPMPPNKTNEELANEFAIHLLEKIEKIRSELTTTEPYTPWAYNTPALWSFTTLTEDRLYKVIMDMPTKSCVLDIVSTKLLKQVLHSCIPAITKIINLSLDKGELSMQWKSAVVRPLIKSLAKGTNINIYRPVSNLPFISKVAEKCTLQQLNDHCDTYNLLPEYQPAYRKNFSCETSLPKLTNDTLWGMENKKITAVIILDLLAAFNTVDHTLLLQVLDTKFRIKDTALHWYEQYLKPRKFRVCINGNYSQEKTLEFSVPQGSTWGACLFISYASTLSEVVPRDLQLSGYVGDHSFWKCFKIEDQSNTMASIESTMLDLKCWMDTVHLRMNESKTEFIYFGSKEMLKKYNISTVNINREQIVRSDKVKYLCGLLDSTLSFHQHVIAKCQAANINLQKIRHIIKFLTRDTCQQLVPSLVMSHQDYANAMLSGIPKTLIQIVQCTQNQAARITLGKTKIRNDSN